MSGPSAKTPGTGGTGPDATPSLEDGQDMAIDTAGPGCHSVLVVEDDEGLREGLRDLLEMDGFEVLTAENGATALQLLDRAERPCLVLLDLMMPVMDGWTFMDAVRQRPGTTVAPLPVVVVSAVADQSVAQSLRTLYNCPLVRKPFDPEAILRLARAHCARGDCRPGA